MNNDLILYYYVWGYNTAEKENIRPMLGTKDGGKKGNNQLSKNKFEVLSSALTNRNGKIWSLI